MRNEAEVEVITSHACEVKLELLQLLNVNTLLSLVWLCCLSVNLILARVPELCPLFHGSWLVLWLEQLPLCSLTLWTWCGPGWQSPPKKCKLLSVGDKRDTRAKTWWIRRLNSALVLPQVHQHHARFYADLSRGRREDTIQRLHSHYPGCYPICRDHVLHIRDPQEAPHR